MNELIAAARGMESQLIAFRRHLHQYPELSLEEAETSALIAARLAALGFDPQTGVGGHGIVAELRGEKPGPLIALRADMDALPIREETGLAFASQRPGVMHACGHDAHATMLLGAAELLAQRRDRLAGTVRFLFQPAEEVNAGAKAMIAAGALEGVQAIYGLHNLPTLAAGKAAVRLGPMMGSVDRIELTLEGKGGHGAMPDQCVDPVVAAAAVVMGLQTAVSREISPFDPAVVTIGSVRAGDANNVIPHRAELTGTVRTFSPAVQRRMPERLERLAGRIAEAYRCRAQLRYIAQTPALIGDAACIAAASRAIDAVLGADNRAEAEPTMAGEDFAIYLQHVPGCFFWLGSGPQENAGQAFGLHHPRFTLNEACLPLGAALFAAIALPS